MVINNEIRSIHLKSIYFHILQLEGENMRSLMQSCRISPKFWPWQKKFRQIDNVYGFNENFMGFSMVDLVNSHLLGKKSYFVLMMTQMWRTVNQIMALYHFFHPQFMTNPMASFIVSRKNIKKSCCKGLPFVPYVFIYNFFCPTDMN